MVNQENLLNLYEVFESENSLYLVMEMYSGGDLVTLIRKNNANFTPEEIQSSMYDLLKGLKALDEMNIMHRDIKPENIMIRTVGGTKEMVIGDFGLASRTDIPKYLLERCGTPGYVAPEIANFKTGERLSSKCDIFSLGVIFHILLCRTHLFNGTNCDEVYSKNKNMEFDLKLPRYDAIDTKALDLLKKMLHEDPSQRISASQAMESSYFWQINDYNKITDTPVTIGCLNQ
jgi:serine/threonine protein kinase